MALLGDSASPSALPPVNAAPPWEHVLRRADLLDLFDTTPDLAGNEIDISRFVRSGEERDVYVAWRDWPGGESAEPPAGLPDIDEAELCPVPVGDFREFAKKHEPWSWNTLEGRWIKPENIYPGITLLLHSKSGGYTLKEGWLPDSSRAVPVVAGAAEQAESHDDDRRSYASCRQSLAGHSEDVAAAMRDLLALLRDPALEPYATALATAARQHDWGKAHPVMQYTLHNGDGPYAELLAKQERSLAAPRHSRRYFRHELASALAMLAVGEEDLAAYLAAAHHGRVRVSIRSMPGEHAGETPLARGVREGDELLPVDLGGGVVRPVVALSLGWMALGRSQAGPSWTDRVLRLRDTLGPFRLAYLELLLRSADERASRMAALEAVR
jgi:CRISPR-associated endonuclease/helicase Cas3